jgi:hypothetical protein
MTWLLAEQDHFSVTAVGNGKRRNSWIKLLDLLAIYTNGIVFIHIRQSWRFCSPLFFSDKTTSIGERRIVSTISAGSPRLSRDGFSSSCQLRENDHLRRRLALIHASVGLHDLINAEGFNWELDLSFDHLLDNAFNRRRLERIGGTRV